MVRLGTVTAFCIALTWTAGGCSWNRQRTNVTDFHRKAGRVTPGTTKANQLASVFGTQPNARLNAPGGKQVLVYNFGEGESKGLNLLVVSFSKTNVGKDSAYFIVDNQGVVEAKYVSKNSADIPWEFWPFGD